MAAKILVAGEDFIDIEVSSYPNAFFCHSQTSREFEFQMSSSINNVEDNRSLSEAITSPADELFYKGKLLPLHLPPRLQMVQKLLQNCPLPDHFDHHHKNPTFEFDHNEDDDDHQLFSTPLASTTKPSPTTTTYNTPFESCQVSRELNPEEYIFEFDDDDHHHEKKKIINNNNKKSWTKKFMNKSSNLGSTIKASRAYLRSLFGKSGGCSCEPCYAVSTKVADESSASKGLTKNTIKSVKRVPFGQIYQKTNNKGKRTSSTTEDGTGSNNNRHRRSFSVGLKLIQSGNKSSSSPSFLVPSKSNGGIVHHHQNLMKRCCSTNSERENSIQGAIAHCKKSHQSSTVTVSDNIINGGTTGLCLFSSSSSSISVCDD
ncbi:probable membrane-associated kinase regulator 4 [Prosopis cineraria]|uniref:probable membrane-associated kinase regulator 4 n=1 Tax=Prosopis cineraria TaxID=364024 RepID=UPI0024104B8D|nr:probable membrane-associated kinase regulator 4 [Prosopis cineraria]